MDHDRGGSTKDLHTSYLHTLRVDAEDSFIKELDIFRFIVPIAISCAISVNIVVKSGKPGLHETVTPHMQIRRNQRRKITLTIIIFTIFYILFNIPLCVNYVLYVVTINMFTYPGPIYCDTFMYHYSWNITAILSVALNSTVNPIIYLTRFSRFKRWVLRVFTEDSDLETSARPTQFDRRKSSVFLNTFSSI